MDLIEIPNTEEDVKLLLRKFPNHCGLNHALRSCIVSRSPNKATLILLGLTGAGKSTTINTLFKEKRLADAKSNSSGTQNINFYDTQFAIEDLKVSNAVFRIIDTPGFGDTETEHMDSKIMAGLQKILESNPDADNDATTAAAAEKQPVPNAICLVMRFTDNRYSGENSPFVRMLKGLSTLKNKLFATDHPNIIIVLTHLMGGTPGLIARPENKCREIEGVVRKHLDITYKSIKVVVAENKGDEYDLAQENGYTKLPNGEFYPYNLLESIKTLMMDAGDMMGNAIVTAAFKDIKSHTFPSTMTHELPNFNDSEVQHLVRVMTTRERQIPHTEINRYLHQAWETTTADFKTDCPTLLDTIQRFFEGRVIHSRCDFPTQKSDTIELLKNIPSTSGVLQLLTQAFGVRIPCLLDEVEDIIGRSYLMESNTIMPHRTIFVRSNSQELSPIGYSVPADVKCEIISNTGLICKFLDSKQKCAQEILKSHGVMTSLAANIKEVGANFKLSNGYNDKSSTSSGNAAQTWTAVYECKKFKLILHNSVPLKASFKTDVNQLSKFDSEEENSRLSYERFFETYGTHIIEAAYGGGSIEMSTSRKMSSSNNSSSAKSNPADVDISATVPKLFTSVFNLKPAAGLKLEGQTQDSDQSEKKNWDFNASFNGGDRSFHSLAFSGEELTEQLRQRPREWENTLDFNPTILQSHLTLSPIEVYAGQVNSERANCIRKAMMHLYSTSGHANRAPPPRSEIPVVVDNRWWYQKMCVIS